MNVLTKLSENRKVTKSVFPPHSHINPNSFCLVAACVSGSQAEWYSKSDFDAGRQAALVKLIFIFIELGVQAVQV